MNKTVLLNRSASDDVKSNMIQYMRGTIKIVDLMYRQEQRLLTLRNATAILTLLSKRRIQPERRLLKAIELVLSETNQPQKY